MQYLPAAAAFLLLVFASACDGDGGSGSPTPATSPAGNPSTPAATATRTPAPVNASPSLDEPLYMALGDSLSAGIGASDILRTGFVPLVHAGLAGDIGLLNIGVPGDTSDDLLNKPGRLDRALDEIARRQNDGIEGNEVRLITLEIGGNDLLDIYFDLVLPGTCPTLAESLQRPQCIDALKSALDRYAPNLEAALHSLQQAGPGIDIFLMTLYNPFSGGVPAFDELGRLALEGIPDTPFPDGLNDIIRRHAAAFGVHLVEIYPLFEGRSGEYIALDFIHANDAGYRVMADAVLEAVASAGIEVRR